MKLPGKLRRKICEFLLDLPNFDDPNHRRAVILRAGLDSNLYNQISFGGPPIDFIELLLSTLGGYGKLGDGRIPLVAVLEATKGLIGPDKREQCDALITEINKFYTITENEIARAKMIIGAIKKFQQDYEIGKKVIVRMQAAFTSMSNT